MNTQRFSRFAIGILLGMLFATGAQAVPVSSTPYFFRTNTLQLDGSTVDLLWIGTIVNPVQNTTALATQGATHVDLTAWANYLEASLPYNPDQLGPWTITATNGPDTTTSVTNDLFGVQPLPFVSNIQIYGELLAPTMTWELPVTSVPYTQIRIRVVDLTGEAIVFTSNPLPANTIVYAMPSGILQPGRDYVLRVMLEEVRGNHLVNRSDTRVHYDLVGVEALPLVGNIQIHGELLTPMVTWELPVTSVPYTQIRIRVTEFAGGALVFASNPLPVNATAYGMPSGVLQPDRDYVLGVMLEEVRDDNLVNRSDARVTYTTYDGPVTILPSGVYYGRRTVRQEGSADRDEILLGALSIKPAAGTVVTARSLVDPNTVIPLYFIGCGIYPNEFFTLSPFNSVVPVAVNTGGATITAENGGMQDQVITHDIVGVQPMPFVENVKISGNPLAPTLSWTLPTVTVPLTEIRVRVLEIDANGCISSDFSSPDLPVTTTTYSIPNGVLIPGSNLYQIRIRLSESRNGKRVNSSEFRIPYPTVGFSNQTALITHYYLSILERDPDPDGLAFWEGLVAERQAGGEDVKPVFRWMADFFFFSPEYLGRNTTDRQFITNLYLTFFQRAPDEGGYAWWLDQLAQGMTRHHAMNGFLYSQEFTDFMEELGF